MLVKIISGILLLVTVYLNFKHGWAGLTNQMKPEEAKMMADLGLNKTMVTIISVLSLAVCVLSLLPQTFFIGNILNAFLIVLIMAFALHSGNYKTALMEIPFFAMPLLLIFLGYPLKK
jgi:hypothetical protein